MNQRSMAICSWRRIPMPIRLKPTIQIIFRRRSRSISRLPTLTFVSATRLTTSSWFSMAANPSPWASTPSIRALKPPPTGSSPTTRFTGPRTISSTMGQPTMTTCLPTEVTMRQAITRWHQGPPMTQPSLLICLPGWSAAPAICCLFQTPMVGWSKPASKTIL